MKFKFTSLLLLIVATAFAGCMKSAAVGNPNNDNPLPTGNFIGSFQLIHTNPTNNRTDTTVANVNVLINTDRTYSVGGDTTTIQAPSHGTYVVDYTNGLITFTDATVTKTTNPNTKKKHLNGAFQYTFTSPNLHIYGSSDTLAFNYTLVAN